MTESIKKLTWDLMILQEMAAQMGDYLKSEALFWPLGHREMPMLTLGGFWLRQHRLNSLQTLLTKDQQTELSKATDLYETAVANWVVRTEQRANTELATRIRQWHEYLRDVWAGNSADMAAYPTQVENRAIMAALLNVLQERPYLLDDALAAKIAFQDKGLQARWQSGPFVWPEEWQPAYPEPEFWWLYGRPK